MNPLRVVSPAQGQQYFIDWVPQSAALGFRFVETTPGRLVLDLPWREDLVGDPETGVLHGGVITTLVDAACGGAILTHLETLRRIATLDLRIDYLRPARPGATLRCTAECYRMTRQVAFARAVVHDGNPDDGLATAAGTFMVFHEEGQPQRRTAPKEAGDGH